MRLFEWLLLAATISLLISAFRSKKQSSIILYAAIGILLFHAVFEGIRWQFYPVYFAFFIGTLLHLQFLKPAWLRYSLFGLSFLITLLGGALAYTLPVFSFPKPTGEFSVGHKTLFMEDTEREEIITPKEGDLRQLNIQCWYPSIEKITQPEPYLNDGYKEAFAISKGMPPIIFSHFGNVQARYQKDLPIAANHTFPVIIISHGLLWNNELYTSIIPELVSQGYAVFGVEHTYESPMTIINGEKIYWSQNYFTEVHGNGDFNSFKEKLEPFKAETDSTKKINLLKEMIADFPGWQESMDNWSKDLSFCLDELELLNEDQSSFFYQKLKLDQVGLIGHSWGGAVVAQAAAQDSRFKAAINMDGAQWGSLIDTVLHTPFLAMYADRDYDSFFTPNFAVYEKVAKDDCYELMIEQTGHANFGDLGYWSKVHSITETGSIPPERMSEITNGLILAFFKQYVLKNDTDFFGAISQDAFPEVVWLSKRVK